MSGTAVRPRRILVTGWFSFLHGEATAGDVLALHRVQQVLDRAGTPYDVAWSPGFRPGALHLADADPAAYSHLVFVCGPLHGAQVEDLHRRFRHCVRVAVGTSVVDGDSPAADGFHTVLARDTPRGDATRDLAAGAPAAPAVPVVGVILTHGQHEYGGRRRHAEVADTVTRWLAGKDCARLELETRLDADDWRLCATPAQFESVVARLDLVITDRLHGLVLALRAGTPPLAVDPVDGGAKLSAQARACGWPAALPGERLSTADLDRWWSWCLTSGRELAGRRGRAFTSRPVPGRDAAPRPEGAGPAGDQADRLPAALSAAVRQRR
ncbi:polysaccharide pyruvyl transferase family protein [Streptomyces sp. B1866]|uniref:polysaccharide pyruvyl transferase family protein n=1 Tax=Streptomyces sp. B1866 TaxID=3075431 RepID=UPI00288D9DB3|nr:polysaccharide pyruvyl transferase family protein [Streptomyces sp. B1866]MDT3399726.1 polysaccharide pyruvyl transferase family protein [Streptomyces sp. B1866]